MVFDYKTLTYPETEEIFENESFRIDPRWHQYVSLAFTFGQRLDRVGYYHGIGTGKTICALLTAIIWGCKRILVVCPSSAFDPWERDIKKATNYKHKLLIGSTKERKKYAENKKLNINVIQYESLKTIYGSLEPTGQPCPYSGKTKKSWQIPRKNYAKYKYDCLILDEVHRCSSYKSIQSKICLNISRNAKHCIALTGTPIDSSLLELFNIQKTMDLGETLGTNFLQFRELYFQEHGFDWDIKKGAQERILKTIAWNTISFDRAECMDLPKEQTEHMFLDKTTEFKKWEKQIFTGKLKINGKEIDISNAIPEKLNQLSSGFIYYYEDEKRKVLRLKDNIKLEIFSDILHSLKGKMIIVYRYDEESKIISEFLTKQKLKHDIICGGLKDKGLSIKKQFVTDKKLKIILLQKTATEGFDGTSANTMLFWSPIASPRVRAQARGRISRSGQTKECLFLELLIKNSSDIYVYNNQTERKKFVKCIMDYIQKFKS